MVLRPGLVSDGGEFLKKLLRVLRTRPATFLSSNVAQVSFSQPSRVDVKIEPCNPNARGLNGQAVLPNLFYVLATIVEFRCQNKALVCIVNAERRDGVAFHPSLGGPEANIGAIEVEVR